jgi:uncharacterized protein YdeI (BOF family)
MEYKVQRPSTVWVETTVEAESFEQALELADELFVEGEFAEVDETFSINYDNYWAKDETGEIKEDY